VAGGGGGVLGTEGTQQHLAAPFYNGLFLLLCIGKGLFINPFFSKFSGLFAFLQPNPKVPRGLGLPPLWPPPFPKRCFPIWERGCWALLVTTFPLGVFWFHGGGGPFCSGFSDLFNSLPFLGGEVWGKICRIWWSKKRGKTFGPEKGFFFFFLGLILLPHPFFLTKKGFSRLSQLWGGGGLSLGFPPPFDFTLCVFLVGPKTLLLPKFSPPS